MIEDAWAVASRYYDAQMRRHLAAIMKAAGINQIQVPVAQFVSAKDTLTIEHNIEGDFYRIKGHFETVPTSTRKP